MKTTIEKCSKHGEYESEVQEIFGKEFQTDCPLCLKEKEDEKFQEVEKEKTLEQQKAIQDKIVKAGIPKRFQECTFSSYQAITDNQKLVLKTSMDYYKDLTKGTSSALFLCGNCGTGKNHLAISILLNLIRRNIKTGIYTKVGKMIRDIRSAYSRNDGPTEQQIIDKYIHTPVLILNEIGVQYGTEGEKVLLFEVIDGRYEEMKPTILISNLSFSDMEKYLGERVLDRLKSKGGALGVFDWESYRGNI